MHRHALDAVDRTLRDITDIDLPFGGKVVVMGGDFRQILPVVPKGTKHEIEAACIKYSTAIWPHVRTFRLTVNMRVRDAADRDFAEYLLRIGDGREPTVAHETVTDLIRIPASMVLSADVSGEELVTQLLHRVYPDLAANWSNPNYIIERAVLAPKNTDVNVINKLATAMFPGIEMTYLS